MMPRPLLNLAAVVCLFGSLLFFFTRDSLSSAIPAFLSPDGGTQTPSQLFSNVYAPHTSSWRSWWHPQRQSGETISTPTSFKWNLLYHLGGNGPWIEKVDDVVDGGIAPPQNCRVEQIHMMSRHAERFPTIGAGARMLAVLEHIRTSKVKLKGSLEFVNGWDFFIEDPSSSLEKLTTTGPFAGTLEAFTTGVKLRTRYAHLLSPTPLPNPSTRPNNKTTLWASDCHRVIETARYFSAGFFGLAWEEKHATLRIIPETPDLGADTLTPGDTCNNYLEDLERGHDYGAHMLAKFRATYLGKVSDRLSKMNDNAIHFTDAEIYSMQEMCGFETLARGSSKWCDVFTVADWENFEYARDVIHFYRAGPGNPYGAPMGFLWLNATAALLAQDPASTGPMFFSFVHDGDIVPLLAALDLFPDADPLPVAGPVPQDRAWRTSQVTPMGGRLILERLSCGTPASSDGKEEAEEERSVFIRVNVNDGIVAIPGCADGPGRSCPLAEFLERVRKRGAEVGDFREVCGLGPEAADRITFLHQ